MNWKFMFLVCFIFLSAGVSVKAAPPAMPTVLNLNLLNTDGSNIDTSQLLTIDYFDSGLIAQSINSVDNPSEIFWGIYGGKSKCYAGVSAKGGTTINITVDGYEPINVTAVEGGTLIGDYYLVSTGGGDTTPPTITITSPTNATYSAATSIDLNVSSDEPIDTWMYSLNNAGNVTFTPNTTIAGVEGPNNLSNGQHTLTVYATDSAGNQNSSSVDFSVETVPVDYADNQPERGNGLNNVTSDDDVYASLAESPTGAMNVTFSSNLIPSDASIKQFSLTVKHYESQSGIELKAYYMPGNNTTWTEISPAPLPNVTSKDDYIVDLKALEIDTPEEANGIKVKWEAIKDGNPNGITYVDQFRIDYEVAGRLDVNLVTPGDNSNWVQNQSYWINATVTCGGYANAVCGDINASARYNVSSSAPDTSINMTSGATPFYIMENVKAVGWVDLSGWWSGVTDPENATDNDVGDETTKAYIDCEWCDNASVKYVWDTTADGNSDASLYYLWEADISDTNVYIEAWNFSSSSWGQLLFIDYWSTDSKETRKLDLDKDYINSTGGIEILFMANDSYDYAEISLYDTWVNIQPSGNSEIKPYDLGCFDIDKGDSCQMSWLVNATGNLNETYEIDTSFTSSYAEVEDKDTDDATVIIVDS